MTEPSQIQQLLRNVHQEAFSQRIARLNSDQRLKIYHQLQNIDQRTLQEQRRLVLSTQHTPHSHAQPYTNVIQSGDAKRIQLGRELISKGKVGCIIVAGGQATRLGLEGPKGLFPITNIREKSFFQLFFEKCVAAGRLAGKALPLSVMTSPLNHEQTSEFLKDHRYFGLSPHQVDLFQQSMLPFLDEKGDLFLENESTIAQGPDGNGSSLKSFVDSGIAAKWRKLGIEFIVYILIDNPLADPFDAELVGVLAETQSDVIIKCTDRRSPSEKVGVIVQVDDNAKVIEYSELPPEASSWDNLYANISLFAFRLDFIEKIAKQPMPLHKAFKQTKAVDAPNGVMSAWKFEKFIFDVLDQTDRINVIHYLRAESFAPLKNKEGSDTARDVRAALLARDREIYREITGKTPPDGPIELSPQFYYPTPEFLSQWKGKSAEPGYIE